MSEEEKLVPRLRFPEFRETANWNVEELADCLDYVQPTPYLVNSTAYDDKYKIPVVTAGKTFVLGYTNEMEGVFETPLPVIIFDDFTTASQFVDFKFKAKSSAMKILLAKENYKIRFMYEAIQQIEYEVGAHGRHWISSYSRIKVPVPSPAEQQKIADCLNSLDELIAAQARKVDALKTHTKGLMHQLFPREGQTRPSLRFPEFHNAQDWRSKELADLVEIHSGSTPSKANPGFWNGSIPWVSAKDMKKLFLEDAEDHISEAAVSGGARLAPSGTLLLLTRGMTLLKNIPICLLQSEMSFNQDVKALRPKTGVDEVFLALILVGSKQRLLAMVGIAGHGTGKLNTDELKAFSLTLPCPKEQQSVANCLTSLHTLITAIVQELETLKTHKKGLMQQLFPSPDEVAA